MGHKNEEVPILEIKNLQKSFLFQSLNKRVRAVDNFSISLKEGEFVGITGKSGSGKSTILKCIYRTYLTDSGEIWYHSRDFGKVNLSTATERDVLYLRRWEIGHATQFLNVMPRTTARQLVEEAVIETGKSKKSASDEAEKMLNHFDLEKELWDCYPSTFSGGEKLRLNIARVMLKKPRLLLLDEPTASLDEESKMKVKLLLQQLKKGGTTMLGIFHDIDFMLDICDRRYHMEIKEQEKRRKTG